MAKGEEAYLGLAQRYRVYQALKNQIAPVSLLPISCPIGIPAYHVDFVLLFNSYYEAVACCPLG